MFYENAKNLICEIIRLAVSDYKAALKRQDREEEKRLESFFKNNWYLGYVIPDVSGNDIIKEVKTQVKQERRTKK